MKKFFFIIALISIFLIVGYLYNQGIIKTDWQWLTVILAAFAGPFRLIQVHLSSKNNKTSSKVQEIINRQKEIEKQEQIIKLQYEALLKQKQLEIEELRAKLQKLENKLEELKLQKQQIQTQVEIMSIEEKSKEFGEYFGT